MSNNTNQQSTNQPNTPLTVIDGKTIVSTGPSNSPTQIRQLFVEKNCDKYQQIDVRLIDAIALVLENEEFVSLIGDVINCNGETLPFIEVVHAEGSVFQRMLNGRVSRQTVKDFIYLVMRMSGRYNIKTTDVFEYLDNNEAISILFNSTDLDPNDFQTTLHLIPDAKPYKHFLISKDGKYVTVFARQRAYVYVCERDGFRIFSNGSYKHKYVIDKKIYASNQVTTSNCINDAIGCTPNNLGQFILNSLALHHEDSMIIEPDVTFEMIKDLDYVYDIIHEMDEMKDNFCRSKIPTLTKLTENPNMTLRIGLDDFTPKCFIDIIENYRGLVDDMVIDYFTRHLRAEGDHDFMMKILSVGEKEVYQYLVENA